MENMKMFQRMVGSARKYVVLDAQVFRLMKDVSESLRAVQGKAIFFIMKEISSEIYRDDMTG